ncbi:hypothetical protein [Lyngbya confervoides]|uniref:DUF4064 domain-containing protein n=1 Tax=Lyngbya confervoides BDU141951 TaxID=1574623 RepID=A0ABD4TA46_9CYAN|nr:hypothetical protein [Lyngbya confervoides]MCM1985401.1 hypothetical protein [Lyngbya confervoides BDU141951]
MQIQPNRDQEQLRLLSTLHYVMGGLTAAMSLFSLIHIGTGIFLLNAEDAFPIEEGASAPPPEFGWIFLGAGLGVLVLGITLAICLICSGRFLSRRTHYTFSFVVACLICLSVPLGTALGVFTILVLSRPTVKQIYGR